MFLVLSVQNSVSYLRDRTSGKLQHTPWEQPANSPQQGPWKTQSNTRKPERREITVGVTEQTRSGKPHVHQDIMLEERQGPPIRGSAIASILHSGQSSGTLAGVSNGISPAKIPLFFVTGKEALLESQIIQPGTASCFGGLLHLNRTRWILCSLANPTRSGGFPWEQTWLGNSACRFRESLRTWEMRAKEWIKVWSFPVSWDKQSSL